MQRRRFLRQGFHGLGLFAMGGMLYRCGGDETKPVGSGSGGGGVGGDGNGGNGGNGGMGGGGVPTMSNIDNLGPLGDADENGVKLPAGFVSRIVARSGEAPVGGGYLWHGAPDGGAVYATDDGGWIYVSNSELSGGMGGVGALVFSPSAEVIDAYSILSGSQRNCAGGPTPWGTWLSCEEVASGLVWECDPLGVAAPVQLPAMGIFSHEAVAVDPLGQQLYLTEDQSDSRLYRFTPTAYPDLSAGTMDVLQIVSGNEGATTWLPLPDPSAATTPTRQQVPASTAFAGGEGIWHHEGVIYFSTKGDNRIWAYEIQSGTITILYDVATSPMPIISGVDNVYVSPFGDVMVAEDGGDLEIVAITQSGNVVPIMQLVGHNQSEIAGPAFDPSLQRLYFSSQRGTSGSSGITFEISGPFFV